MKNLIIIFLLVLAFAAHAKASLPNEILEGIRVRSVSVVYVSEIDSDVIAFSGSGRVTTLNERSFRRTAGIDPAWQIEEMDFDAFFDRVLANDATGQWYEPIYYLRENLTDLKVYRTGDIRVRYYAVGLYQHQVIGITFEAVET